MNYLTLDHLLKTTLRHFTLEDEVIQDLEANMDGGKLKLFQLLQAVIISKHTENRSIINFKVLELGFGIYKEKTNLSNEQIGEKIGRVGERVRNVLGDIDRDFNKIFSFLYDIPFADALQQDKWAALDFICLPENVCNKINEFNSTSFSQKFITRIMGVLMRNSHRFVGSNTDDRWKCGYLIEKKLYSFNYIRFIKDLRLKLGANPIRKIDTTWTFEDILSSYSEQRVQEQDDAIIQTLITIINQEFEYLMLDEHGIVIPRNAVKTIPEYIQEAFDHLGYDPRGHAVAEIYDFLVDSYPCQNWNKSSLGNLAAGSRAFEALGKKGAFVSKKWLDDGADIILGKIPEVALEILKREPMPLNIIELTEKMSRYRRDMDIKSVTSYINKKPGIAQNESFYGYEQNDQHTTFLKQLRSSKGSVANWKRFDGMPIPELYREMMDKGFPREQVDYMLEFKKADGQVQVFNDKLVYLSSSTGGSWGDTSSQGQTPIPPIKPQKDKTVLIDKLSSLDQTDGFRPATVRFEQFLLRSILFFGMRECNCAICGRTFPIGFLVAAHIHKRSHCTHAQRKDPNIVMPACAFGCDMLFEKGIICVDETGLVSVNTKKLMGIEVSKHLSLCLGRTCSHHNPQSQGYFGLHRAQHQYVPDSQSL
ncbi:hypothetical protein ACEN2P_20205 [Pedobacter psychrotolerans]|uniref:hypothetical protein n=1 Tax=Pedobacter psychrotolerans TaxID=1843235 RepID=UPI003F958E40